MRIAQHMLAIVMLNHIVGCFWFAIGRHADGGWVEDQLTYKTFAFAYLTSFHWSLTQFHGSMEVVPQTVEERAFAVVILLWALFTFSWFLSSMTNAMMRLQSVHTSWYVQKSKLLQYFQERHISTTLGARIRSFVDSHACSPFIEENEVTLLKIVPDSMLKEIH